MTYSHGLETEWVDTRLKLCPRPRIGIEPRNPYIYWRASRTHMHGKISENLLQLAEVGGWHVFTRGYGTGQDGFTKFRISWIHASSWPTLSRTLQCLWHDELNTCCDNVVWYNWPVMRSAYICLCAFSCIRVYRPSCFFCILSITGCLYTIVVFEWSSNAILLFFWHQVASVSDQLRSLNKFITFNLKIKYFSVFLDYCCQFKAQWNWRSCI